MMSLWGMVALTGVIINDAIVFLAKYDGFLLEGKTVKEAIREAGKTRLRPIILTSLTTTIGLFPILLEKSVQAQFLIPMAISLAYGVAIGTIFILIFFPVLIIILNDFSVYFSYLLIGRKPERGYPSVPGSGRYRSLLPRISVSLPPDLVEPIQWKPRSLQIR